MGGGDGGASDSDIEDTIQVDNKEGKQDDDTSFFGKINPFARSSSKD
jgi:hypothetical protein